MDSLSQLETPDIEQNYYCSPSMTAVTVDQEQWISLIYFLLLLFVKDCLCCSSHKYHTITSTTPTKFNFQRNPRNMDGSPILDLSKNLVLIHVHFSSKWGWGLVFPWVLFLAAWVYCHKAAGQHHQSNCYQPRLAQYSQHYLKMNKWATTVDTKHNNNNVIIVWKK